MTPARKCGERPRRSGAESAAAAGLWGWEGGGKSGGAGRGSGRGGHPGGQRKPEAGGKALRGEGRKEGAKGWRLDSGEGVQKAKIGARVAGRVQRTSEAGLCGRHLDFFDRVWNLVCRKGEKT